MQVESPTFVYPCQSRQCPAACPRRARTSTPPTALKSKTWTTLAGSLSTDLPIPCRTVLFVNLFSDYLVEVMTSNYNCFTKQELGNRIAEKLFYKIMILMLSQTRRCCWVRRPASSGVLVLGSGNRSGPGNGQLRGRRNDQPNKGRSESQSDQLPTGRSQRSERWSAPRPSWSCGRPRRARTTPSVCTTRRYSTGTRTAATVCAITQCHISPASLTSSHFDNTFLLLIS